MPKILISSSLLNYPYFGLNQLYNFDPNRANDKGANYYKSILSFSLYTLVDTGR